MSIGHTLDAFIGPMYFYDIHAQYVSHSWREKLSPFVKFNPLSAVSNYTVHGNLTFL